MCPLFRTIVLTMGGLRAIRPAGEDGRQEAEAEGVAMRRLWSTWGIGLCLGLTGCAATERRVVLDPGAGPPGASALPVADALPPPQVHCECGPVLPPVPVPQPTPAPPTATLA